MGYFGFVHTSAHGIMDSGYWILDAGLDTYLGKVLA